MTRTEKLLAELVALPSVNPGFAPGLAQAEEAASSPPSSAGCGPGQRRGTETAAQRAGGLYGEKNVADFLATIAAKAGLEIEFQAVLPGRPNLIARLLPRQRLTQTILLAPHLDTVGAEDACFVPRRKNGRLYGRGTCDTKGSVVAMLTALCELAESPVRPLTTQIVFAGLADEEYAQAGSRALAATGFQADLAIVGEPTRLQVVTAHKGSLWLELTTRGKAAHGATPHLGKNAVYEMARVVGAIESEYAAQLQRRGHKLLGPATVSVGQISGGTQPNIVPAGCTITVDRRTLPGETDAQVFREIAALLRRRNLKATIANTKIAPAPAMETNPELPQVRQLFAVVGQTRPAGVNYFCDAAVLAAGGLPCVVFGPGDIAQAHTADEWISLAQLERAKELLLRFLKSLP